MDSLENVSEYVRDNNELKRALCIDAHCSLEVRPLAQGEHNVNYTLDSSDGKSFVLRVNAVSQMGLPDQIRYEYDALRLLEPSCCTPHALYVDDEPGSPGKGALVMSFCPGSWLDYHKSDDIKTAARLLANVHSVAPAPRNRLVKPRDPLATQLEECKRHFEGYRNSAFEEARVTCAIERLFAKAHESALKAGAARDTAHILNTEAVQSHFLISEKAPLGGYLVDWEKPILGEVAQDVAYFLAPTTTIWDDTFMFDAEQRASFVETYWNAVDGRFSRDGFDARFAAFLQSNCLRGITWSCNAWVEYHDPARPLKNEKTFAKLQTYFSKDFLDHVERDCFDR